MKNNRFDIFSPTLLQLIKTVQGIKSRKLAEYDLKGTNVVCLCAILDSDERGLSATELSHVCEIDKAQVSRCMKELIDKKLVYRNDADGRKYKQKYRLTQSGLAATKDIDETSKQLQAVLKKNLNPEDMDAFYRVLNTMCENFAALPEQER